MLQLFDKAIECGQLFEHKEFCTRRDTDRGVNKFDREEHRVHIAIATRQIATLVVLLVHVVAERANKWQKRTAISLMLVELGSQGVQSCATHQHRAGWS